MNTALKTPINKNAFKRTIAINRIRKMKKRIRVIQGGTSAGKTYGIIPILIDRATKNPGIEISIVSETMPHLKRGAIKDFKKIMRQTYRWKRAHWHESDKIYTFHHKGGQVSTIEFFSVDDEAKVRGPRRNVLYVNEANNIKWETFYQLLIRTDEQVYLDYNPVSEFWAHTEIIPKKNCEFLKLTYKDNDALANTIVEELESNLEKAFYRVNIPWDELFEKKNIKNAYWANWCKVYLFGEVGNLEGAVFTNWEQVEIVPDEAKLIGYGMDFGYTNDPTALVAVYKCDNQYYFHQLIYQRGLKTNELAELMKENRVNKRIPIYADSAEPKTIDELAEYGYMIEGAEKGADSIIFGIQQLQDIKMYITKDSVDLIKELRNYLWHKDRKTGAQLNKPIDLYNHAIDAIRYFAIMMLGKVKRGGYVDVDIIN